VLDVFSLPGAHNRENLAAAIGAVCDLASAGEIRAAAGNFRGVPHRLQTVATVGGVRYINSSIDTSPIRTAAALSALSGKPLVIAGGRTKGLSLAPLADALAARAAAVLAYGEAAREIAALLGDRVPCTVCEKFDGAFFAAARAARAGDTVLLSPGCTAYGEFRDFEERGERFCRLVEALAKERT
jgi:UDP-N-acetylmuramoylalanine--D-glutamate ligase